MVYNIHPNIEPNADSISVDEKPLIAVNNDWQDFEDIPQLQNNLDMVIKTPGIIPSSELVKINPKLF